MRGTALAQAAPGRLRYQDRASVLRSTKTNQPGKGTRSAASLACHVLSKSGLPLARRLAARLAAEPWRAPSGATAAACQICAPARLHVRDVRPFERLADFLAQEYQRHAAHIFIGSTGIAVRVLAPLIRHKSLDPPVVVLDPAGRFVISLLAGHWGGGNELTRHLARLLGAAPVITTASDQPATWPEEHAAEEQAPVRSRLAPEAPPRALDLLIRDAGLRILDWERLPRAQAALLEGRRLRLWDPCAAMPAAVPPAFERLPGTEGDARPPRPAFAGLIDGACPADEATCPRPLLAAHWRRLAPAPGLLRLAVPRLYVGLGCRKNLPPDAILPEMEALFAAHGLELRAVAALATVAEKLTEAALQALAERLDIPLRGFAAAELARCATPNPSEAAGRRFGLAPFSVCEASALLAAGQAPALGQASRLLIPKHTAQARLTLAVALAAQPPQYS